MRRPARWSTLAAAAALSWCAGSAAPAEDATTDGLDVRRVRLRADTSQRPGVHDGAIRMTAILDDGPPTSVLGGIVASGLTARVRTAAGVDVSVDWTAAECTARPAARGPLITCEHMGATPRRARLRPAPDRFAVLLDAKGLAFAPPLSADPVTLTLTIGGLARADDIDQCAVSGGAHQVERCRESGAQPTPTPSGTATPTYTATSTWTPTVLASLGSHACTFASSSEFELRTAALPLHLLPHGSLQISCGSIDSDGSAECACSIDSLPSMVIPSIGDLCVSPVPGCSPGHIDCDGGRAADTALTAEHSLGACASNAACAAACAGFCAGIDATVLHSACEGYCQGGSAAEQACTAESDCAGGTCGGGNGVLHADTCNCVCRSAELLPASADVSLDCGLGMQVTLEAGANGVCGDPPSLTLEPLCAAMTTRAATGQVFDANNNSGTTIPTLGPLLLSGMPISCAALSTGTLSGLELVGQIASFDSVLGDLLVWGRFVCQ